MSRVDWLNYVTVLMWPERKQTFSTVMEQSPRYGKWQKQVAEQLMYFASICVKKWTTVH